MTDQQFYYDRQHVCYPYFFNTRTQRRNQPISHKQACKLISTITQDVGPRGSYGTHRLCKTWGYHARTNGVELASSCPNIEKRTITDDELEAVMRNLDL